MFTPKNIAVIGFGEAGSIIAEGCISGSKRQQKDVACHAWDLRMRDPDAKKELQNKADELGLTMHEETGDWLKDMDVVFSLVFGATTIFFQLQQALNELWDIQPAPKKALVKFLLDRANSLGMILILGFLLMITMVLSSMISLFNNFITSSKVCKKSLNLINTVNGSRIWLNYLCGTTSFNIEFILLLIVLLLICLINFH